MTRRGMRLAILVLAAACVMAAAAPARAFCVENRSSHDLRVHLETTNPYGAYAVLFKPGDRACCAWFDRRCNPTRKRDGMLSFSVRSKHRYPNTRYCVSGLMRGAFTTADGSITIVDDRTSRGGLECDSRDGQKKPVTRDTFVRRSLKQRGMPPPIIVPPPPGR